MQPAPIAARTDRLNPSDLAGVTSSIGLYTLKIEIRSSQGFQLDILKNRNHRNDVGDHAAQGQDRPDRSGSPPHMVQRRRQQGVAVDRQTQDGEIDGGPDQGPRESAARAGSCNEARSKHPRTGPPPGSPDRPSRPGPETPDRSSGATGRDKIRSIVPRSISAATAADPRPIAQIEIKSMISGWFQNVIMIETDVRLNPHHPHELEPPATSEPDSSMRMISASVRAVT